MPVRLACQSEERRESLASVEVVVHRRRKVGSGGCDGVVQRLRLPVTTRRGAVTVVCLCEPVVSSCRLVKRSVAEVDWRTVVGIEQIEAHHLGAGVLQDIAH